MGIDHRMVHFRADDTSELVAEIDAIAERGDDREWVTLSPWVDAEDIPVRSVLRRLMSGRGPKIPEVTWVGASGDVPAQLGILHSTGPDAIPRLAAVGIEPPRGWRSVQDHSKRGLLFAIPPDAPTRELVDFALGAAGELAEVPTDDRWVAQISRMR